MRLMEQGHARRMMDCLTTDESEAIPALEQGRLVYAVETPAGEWGQVMSIEAFHAKGRRATSYSVTFASGHVRVFKRGGTFWVERDRGLAEYDYTTDEVPGGDDG